MKFIDLITEGSLDYRKEDNIKFKVIKSHNIKDVPPYLTKTKVIQMENDKTYSGLITQIDNDGEIRIKGHLRNKFIGNYIITKPKESISVTSVTPPTGGYKKKLPASFFTDD